MSYHMISIYTHLTMLLTFQSHSNDSKSVARIAIVKPDKAEEVSNMIMSMAQGGRLQEKISEIRLKQMIESLEQAKKPTKITVS